MKPHDPTHRLLHRLKHPSIRLGLGLGLKGGGGGATPALDLNFLSGALDSRITFSRASTGTRVNASGLIESVAINEPRFDYDPATLAPRGLLIEEQRTNLANSSDDISTVSYSTTGLTRSTDGTTGPNGTAFHMVTADAGNNKHEVYNPAAYAITSTASYATAVYFKPGTSRYAFLNWETAANNYATAVFDCQGTNSLAATQTSVGSSSGTIISAFGEYVGNGTYRLVLVASAAGASAYFVFGLAGAATGNTLNASGELIWTAAGIETGYFDLVDVQAGSFITSHIPTGASQVTRAADNLSIMGANFSNWFIPSEGTLLVTTELPAAANGQPLSVYDTTAFTANMLALYKRTSTTMSFQIYTSSITQADLQMQALSTGVHNFALAYKLDDCAACADGGAVIAHTVAAMPVNLANLSIGRYKDTGTAYINGHIRSLRYYRLRLPNATLRSLSA